jgi:hypothetical protein
VWHVSLSMPTPRGPYSTDRWTKQQRNEARRVAMRLLDGVGQDPEQHDQYPFSWQLRRSLTDAEMARLDPAWCALPAVDEGGTPEEVRALLIELGKLPA